MTTSTPVTRTESVLSPLHAAADQLYAAGTQVGADTPLGSWLMSDVAAPTLFALVGVLLMLLAWRLRRGRKLRKARPVPAAATVATESVGSGRSTHPEALAMLYDAPSRREPVMSAPDQEPSAKGQEPSAKAQEHSASGQPPFGVGPAAAPVAAMAAVTGEARREPASPAAGAAGENPSLRLMVSAVDRLLQRVESQQAQIHALLDELKAQSSALLVQGERLLALEARVAGLGAGGAVGAAAEAASTDQLPSLEQAIALAAQGADEHELVNRLGLSAAEARLINLVHGPAGGIAPESPA